MTELGFRLHGPFASLEARYAIRQPSPTGSPLALAGEVGAVASGTSPPGAGGEARCGSAIGDESTAATQPVVRPGGSGIAVSGLPTRGA